MLRQPKLSEVLLPAVSAQVLEIVLMATNMLFELYTIHLLATNVAKACSLVYWLIASTASCGLLYQLFYVLVSHFMLHTQVLLEGS
jgi:hypothetical protein